MKSRLYNFCLKAMAMCVVWACVCLTAYSQSPGGRDESIRLETTLVQVPVVVRDNGGRYITDLTERDFTIYEDGVEQRIEFFKSIEEPFNVALLLDSSGSTAEQLGMIKAAALAFIENLRPQDRVMVVGFSDSVQVECELTDDKDVLRRSVAAIRPGEFTQVYEAVYTAVWERLHDIEGRKAIILFTDGIDTASSEIGAEDTLDAVLESEDIIVYSIRYNTRGDVEKKLEAKLEGHNISAGRDRISLGWQDVQRELDRSYREADLYLNELAEMSGGIVERSDTLGDLRIAFDRIADELRHQYLLGYYPLKPRVDDRERRIYVTVSRKGSRVRTRLSYR